MKSEKANFTHKNKIKTISSTILSGWQVLEAGQLVFGFISLVSKYAAGMTSKWRPISFCQLAA